MITGSDRRIELLRLTMRTFLIARWKTAANASPPNIKTGVSTQDAVASTTAVSRKIDAANMVVSISARLLSTSARWTLKLAAFTPEVHRPESDMVSFSVGVLSINRVLHSIDDYRP